MAKAGGQAATWTPGQVVVSAMISRPGRLGVASWRPSQAGRKMRRE
jgi:hypothetical protein